MAEIALGAQSFLGKLEIDAALTSLGIEPAIEILESLPFNSTSMKRDPGAATFDATLAFVAQTLNSKMQPVDELVATDAWARKRVFSHILGGVAAAVGNRAFFCNAADGDLVHRIQNGSLLEIELAIHPDGEMSFGRCLAIGEKTASGDGAAVQLGAITDGQTMFAAFHVPRDLVTLAGTIDMKIQSASDEAFTTPNDRITFAQVGTSPAYEWATLTPSGGITDTWWRASWASASTPDHYVALCAGIR